MQWTLIILLFVLSACGGQARKESSSYGAARIAVLSSALAESEIMAVRCTVRVPGEAAIMEEDLDRVGEYYSGEFLKLPAGVCLEFYIEAITHDGEILTSGSAVAVLSPGRTTGIHIVLQEIEEEEAPENASPYILSAQVSSTEVISGGSVALSVEAADPDPGDTLAYRWTAQAGVFSAPGEASTTWTAPETEGSVLISISVSDGAWHEVSLTVQVLVKSNDDQEAFGGASVIVEVNHNPEVAGTTAEPKTAGPGENVAVRVVAADPDGDALSFAWRDHCDGVFDDPAAASTRWTAPQAIRVCLLRVSVTDEHGAASIGVLAVPVAISEGFNSAPAISGVFTSALRVMAGHGLQMSVEVSDPDGDELSYSWSDDCLGVFNTPSASATEWTAPGAVGECDIRISVDDGRGGNDLYGFNVSVEPSSPPVLAGIEPSAALAGEVIVIKASSLASMPEWNTVRFNETIATIVSMPPGEFAAIVPEGLPGDVLDVTVETMAGWSGAALFTNLSNRAYVNYLDGVAALDTASMTVVGSVDVREDYGNLVVSPDGRMVVRRNFWSNTVSLLNAAALGLIVEVQVGTHPAQMAYDPDGRHLYVVNFESNDVSVVDTRPEDDSTPKVVATIPAGIGPVNMAFTEDGGRALVPNLRGYTLSEMDITPGSPTFRQKTAEILLPYGRPYGVVVMGGEALVSNQKHAGSVSIVDTDPLSQTYRQQVSEHPAGGWPSQMLNIPGSVRVYVGVYDPAADMSFLRVFDMGGHEFQPDRVDVHKGAWALTYAEMTGELLAASGPTWDEADGEVFFIDAAPESPTYNGVNAVVRIEGYVEAMVLLPDGRALIPEGPTNRLSVLDVRTRSITQSVEIGEYAMELAVSPR